jgi:hypothetical protein
VTISLLFRPCTLIRLVAGVILASEVGPTTRRGIAHFSNFSVANGTSNSEAILSFPSAVRSHSRASVCKDLQGINTDGYAGDRSQGTSGQRKVRLFSLSISPNNIDLVVPESC